MAKKREVDLIKNTIILSLGTYLPKLTTLVTLPLLTGYLTKSEYGTYDLIATLVSLLLPAFTLQIQTAAFRFLVSKRDSSEEKEKIITNIYAFIIPISLICLFISYFVLNSIDSITRILILSYFFTDILSSASGQITRGLGKNSIFAISAIIKSIVIMLGTCWALLIAKKGINGLIIGMLVANIVNCMVLVKASHLHKFIKIRSLSWISLKEMLGYSWPMVPNALSNWVLSLSDRLVITSFIGLEANAVYAIANKIPHLVKDFQGNFVNAWSENATLNLEDKDGTEYYSYVYRNVCKLTAGIVVGLIGVSPIIFKLLVKGDYSEALRQMPILYMAMYFSCISSFLGGIYIAHKKTKSIGLTTTIAAIINISIDLLFVKKIGIYAGSISTLIAYLFLFIFRVFDVRKFRPLKIKWGEQGIIIVLLFMMCALAYINLIYFNIINFLIGCSLAFFWNKNLIISTYKYVINKIKKCLKKGEKE